MSLPPRPLLASARLVALGLALACSAAWAEKPHAAATSLNPQASLELLKEGNQRFVKGTAKHEGSGPAARKLLVSGQSPHTIVLSCSDSRVPPEFVFDQGLGKIFVVRVAGNVVNASNMASIEYAVEHLGARLLVVLGHESCGAVHAALATPDNQSAGSVALDGLLGTIRHNLGRLKQTPDALADKTLTAPVKKNVEASLAQVASASPLLKERLAKGELVLVPAIYSLSTGAVSFWGTEALAQPHKP